MKLQNTRNTNGLSSIIRSENDENSASGFDPFGSPFGPEGVPPEINFPNPVHAEQYRKIREKAKNSPPLPYLSATQLSRATNPRPSAGNSSPSQGPPAQSGGTSSNPPAGAAGNGTQAGQQEARAPSVTPNTTTAATPSTKTTTTTDASATASKNKTGIT